LGDGASVSVEFLPSSARSGHTCGEFDCELGKHINLAATSLKGDWDTCPVSESGSWRASHSPTVNHDRVCADDVVRQEPHVFDDCVMTHHAVRERTIGEASHHFDTVGERDILGKAAENDIPPEVAVSDPARVERVGNSDPRPVLGGVSLSLKLRNLGFAQPTENGVTQGQSHATITSDGGHDLEQVRFRGQAVYHCVKGFVHGSSSKHWAGAAT
jgi:hypothetical protein